MKLIPVFDPTRFCMKLIPVFLPSHEIIGYLADDQIPRVQYETRSSFRLEAAPILNVVAFDPRHMLADAPTDVDVHSVVFSWEMIRSVRGDKDLYQEQGIHRVYVLMVASDSYQYMGRIRGFRHFAEVEGERV